MPRSSYSGLRTNRGFLHANPASFVYELTPVPTPADLLPTPAFSPIFIPVGERPPVIEIRYCTTERLGFRAEFKACKPTGGGDATKTGLNTNTFYRLAFGFFY
jgi:hypothetical protein